MDNQLFNNLLMSLVLLLLLVSDLALASSREKLSPEELLNKAVDTERSRLQARAKFEPAFVPFSTSGRRSLLPDGNLISDPRRVLHSHVVRITTGNGYVGTGLLLKKQFVLTAKTLLLNDYASPKDIRIQLGVRLAQGNRLYLHPVENLAVVRISTPINDTGRIPMTDSPKGFFWPVAKTNPILGSQLKSYGYGTVTGCRQNCTYPLSSHTFPVSDFLCNETIITAPINSASPIHLPDIGSPVFSDNERDLVALLLVGPLPEAILASVTPYKDWIYNSMRCDCNPGGESTSWSLAVRNHSDLLVCYYCDIVRAERIEISLTSHTGCRDGWKAMVIRDELGRTITTLETGGEGEESSAVILKAEDFKGSSYFYVEAWKMQGRERREVSTYGGYTVRDYMDGAMHFHWCEA